MSGTTRQVILRTGTLATLIILSVLAVAVGAGALPHGVRELVLVVRNSGLNTIDRESVTNAYYQGLIDGEDNTDPKEPGVKFAKAGFMRLRPGFLAAENLPNVSLWFRGVFMELNSYGMRDQEYAKERTEGTLRIAMVGASNTMGLGAHADSIFESRLERRLNAEFDFPVEVINFGVPGYGVVELCYAIDTYVGSFNPDLVLLVLPELQRSARTPFMTEWRVHSGRQLHYDFFHELVRRAELTPGDSPVRIKRRLRPLYSELFGKTFKTLKGISDTQGVPIATVILKAIAMPDTGRSLLDMAAQAEANGIHPIRVYEAFVGQDKYDVYVDLDNGDSHPNDFGHGLIAEQLYQALMTDEVIRPLLVPRGGGQTVTSQQQTSVSDD